MNDNSRRPLQIPSWHIPYMEKHRMYELFHELGRELVIQQPEDHVSFIKEILLNTHLNRDNARVIIICPPRTNCDKVAYRISSITHQVVITKFRLEEITKVAKKTLKPSQVAKVIAKLVRKENAYKKGWILVNVLRTAEEAKALLKLGILPTHCLYLVSPFYPALDELKYCDVPIGWAECRRQLIALRNVFNHILVDIPLKHLSPQEVADSCIETITTRKGKIAIIPRVILFGPRGSGRNTQARLLAKAMNLVHIDFQYLLCQAWTSKTELSERLRSCQERVCFHSEILVQLLNKRILEEDCLRNGWVLTGFPFNKADLMFLDCVDTPPNRIIFLECDLNVCRERVMHKGMRVHTESDIKDTAEVQVDNREPNPPHNKINVVDSEHLYYCEQYPQLRDYCAGTESVVNADQQKRWVHECIVGIILKESPPYAPRKPFEDEPLPKIPSEMDEFFELCKCGPFPPKMLDMFKTRL